MITSTSGKINQYWQEWVKKRNRPGNPQTLQSRNIYVLPSSFGWAYALVVLTLMTGAINYQINSMYFMAFILMIIGFMSAWQACANLRHLSFKFIAIEDAQQGTPAKMTLAIRANHKMRFGLEFQIGAQPKTRLETIPPEGLKFIVPIETVERGYFRLPRISISSLFPFGIFQVWSYAYFDEHYYVYPQPVNPGFWPTPFLDQNLKQKHTAGDEELYDLKQVENPWRVPNLIAWRIAAKGQGWYLKTMESNEADYWVFKLNDLPSANLEDKLKYLSYWLQTAELNGQLYGLELPAAKTPLAHGKEHLQQCLRLLALYP